MFDKRYDIGNKFSSTKVIACKILQELQEKPRFPTLSFTEHKDDLHFSNRVGRVPTAWEKNPFQPLKKLFVCTYIDHALFISFGIHVPNRVCVHLYLSGLIQFSPYKFVMRHSKDVLTKQCFMSITEDAQDNVFTSNGSRNSNLPKAVFFIPSRSAVTTLSALRLIRSDTFILSWIPAIKCIQSGMFIPKRVASALSSTLKTFKVISSS